MKFSKGNAKLGTNCFVVSRAVGDTCPSSCVFLHNGCYAEATEKRFPNARVAGLKNSITESIKIRSLILEAIRKNVSIRLHERGDFGSNDTLDFDYIENWRSACAQLVSEGYDLPIMWAYTHFYCRELVELLGEYIYIYASVHNEDDHAKAKAEGFEHFAYVDTDHRFTTKKKKGGSNNAPKLVVFNNDKYLVCPEQRKGRKSVTCTGNKESVACKWCLKGGNVAFIEH